MGAHMKTTIDVSDVLFNSAKRLAHSKQTTLRALVEEGLRRVLADSQTKAKPAFKLKDASVRGKEILISDPQRWQQMEEEHVVSRAVKLRA
jgi:Bacterial antitoxin of type II TA system, VapB